MWTEQIALDDQIRIDVGATTCGASGISLTVVRIGRMECAAHIAEPSQALMLLGSLAEALGQMGWLSNAGKSFFAATILAESQRLEAGG